VFARYLGSVDPNTSLDNFEERGSPIIDLIDRGKLQIVDQSSQPGLAQIVLSVASPEMRGGIVVIDYLQIIPLKGGQASRQLLIKEVLDEIRVEAHKNNVLVLVLSQLTPDYNNPSNDAPREARDIHYSADQVLRVWNKSVGDNHPKYEKLKGKYVIHVFLNRDGESNIVFDSTLEKGMYLNILNRAKEV
jgi:replicative DNA helicase